MRRILLIGNQNKTLRGVQDCFLEEYQVQLCSEKIDTVKDMVKLTSPDLVVISQIGLSNEDIEIFDFFMEQYMWLPILVIAQKEMESHFVELMGKNKNVLPIYRPITKTKLLECSRRLLGTEESKNAATEQKVSMPDDGDSSQVFERKRILIVDDSPIVLHSLTRLLEERYMVTVAKSGEYALQILTKLQVDLVLLDYEMPGWDGKKTLEMMKQNDQTKNIPVVFLTGLSDKEHILAVLQLNPAGYLLKPPVQEELFEMIDTVFDM